MKRWQIRLLRLFPGFLDDHIEAELYVADVIHHDDGGVVLHDSQDFVEYESLSYAWGDSVFDHDMYLNGKTVKTTSSLGSALKHLRSESTFRWLWCDALCKCAKQFQAARN